MKKAIVALAIVVALAITGCAGTTTQKQDAIIGIVAQDVGYGVYRAVPDSRPILATLCLIKDFSNPVLVAYRLREAMEQIWTEASKITDQDAQIVLLTLNNLVGLLDANTVLGESASEADIERARDVLKLVISKICEGVNLAGGGK